MKFCSASRYTAVFFVLTLLIISANVGLAQTRWLKYLNNPILVRGEPGEWDRKGILHPTVLLKDGAYLMWYDAQDETSRYRHRIGYATSLDGVVWEKYDDLTTTNTLFASSDPVLVPGPSGSWDSWGILSPTVIFNDSKNEYEMWYHGYGGSYNRIGHATSTDGIHWEKYDKDGDGESDPVLDVGGLGKFDSKNACDPMVIFNSSKSEYEMWYTGDDGSNSRIGYATSSDGVTWEKHESNPVLNPGLVGAWDSYHVASPAVRLNENQYEMWHAGHDGSNQRIGYATSSNGYEWTKYERDDDTDDIPDYVLDIGDPGEWDEKHATSPTVLFNGVGYEMWYSGYDIDVATIGYAVSTPISAIITVDDDLVDLPDADFTTIQDAIDAANTGDTVIVFDGIYTGYRNKNLDFHGKDITVKSQNGRENTVIDCENDGRGFYFHSGETLESVVDGFAVRNGNANGGGAILCGDNLGNSSPTIINNIIEGCSGGSGGGGGIHLYSESSPLLKSNIIRNNYTSAAGGAIYCTHQASPDMTSNIITDNRADRFGGGIVCSPSSTSVLANNIIARNMAGEHGGAIYFDRYSTVTIVNNTIIENQSSYGSGLYCFNITSLTIVNTILWNNGQYELSGHTSVIDITYSDIQGGWAGEGNINADPSFEDAPNGDYHLGNDSPCIGAGIMTSGVPDEDIEGNSRPNPPSSNPDIGTYENSLGAPLSSISASIDEYHPNNPVEVVVGNSVNLSLTFTNTGDIAWEFIVGASVWDSNGVKVADYEETLASPLQPGQQTTAEWFHTVDQPGDYWLQFGVWKAMPYIEENLLDRQPSPSQSLIVGMPPSQPRTIYVDDDNITGPWDGTQDYPYQYIQDGIDAAFGGDTVLVLDGTYTGDRNKNLDFYGKVITVKSQNGRENTVIDCENDGRGFHFHSGETLESVVDGFAIRNGNANGGGAIACGDNLGDSSPTIINNIIEGCSGGSGGGGGIHCTLGSSPLLKNNIIRNNYTSVDGGGIYCTHQASPDMKNNIITDNRADRFGGGIVCAASSTSVLANNIIARNTSGEHAGAVYFNRYSNVTLVNNTITQNNASYGSGLYCHNITSLTIVNTILWNNGQDELSGYTSVIDITYSDIQGGWAGEGNIDAEPSFEDAPNGDYHLGNDSFCIGAGNKDAPHMPITDIEGNPRPNPDNSNPDMGAYESALGSPEVADHSPNRPLNVSPTDKAFGIAFMPTLKSSTFSDPDQGDTHAASQWQVTNAPGVYSIPVFDSGSDPKHLTQIVVPPWKLEEITIYYWRVRHQDSHNAWSEWSQETLFITCRLGIQYVEYDPLRPGEESEVRICVVVREYGLYYVEISDADWPFVPAPTPAISLEPNESHIINMWVTPRSNEYGVDQVKFTLKKISEWFNPEVGSSYSQCLIVDRHSLEEEPRWSKEEVQALVKRYAPILKMDKSAGEYFPKDVQIWMDEGILKDDDENIIVSRGITSSQLCQFSSPDLCLDLRGNDPLELWTNWESIQESYDNVVYATAVQEEGGQRRIAAQYWIPYYCSDWRRHDPHYGYNNHEGDWENITLVLSSEGEPLFAAYSQHETWNTWLRRLGFEDVAGGHRRHWDRIPKLVLKDGNLTDHPIVYVGLGAHASYFQAGSEYYYLPAPPPEWPPLKWYTETFSGSGNWVIPIEICTTDMIVHTPTVPLDKVILLPRASSISSGNDDCSWIIFSGHWGQRNLTGTGHLGDDGSRGPLFSEDRSTQEIGGERGFRWLNPWIWSDQKPSDSDYDGPGKADGSSNLRAFLEIVDDGGDDDDPPENGKIVKFEATYNYKQDHPSNNTEKYDSMPGTSLKCRLRYGDGDGKNDLSDIKPLDPSAPSVTFEHEYPWDVVFDGVIAELYIWEENGITTQECFALKSDCKGVPVVGVDELDLGIDACCPVNLVITDPEGRTVGIDTSDIPSATYVETDLNGDGDPDDMVIIPDALMGDYLIVVIPELDAVETDTFTLEVWHGGTNVGNSVTIVEDEMIRDITSEGYAFRFVENSDGTLDIILPNMSGSTKGAGWFVRDGNFRNSIMLDIVCEEGAIQEGSYLKYLDGKTRMFLMSSSIGSFSISDSTCNFSGDCTINRDSGFSFEATVTDANPDEISISVTGPDDFSYSCSGALVGGNIVVSTDTGGGAAPLKLPRKTQLLQNYPNPFNPDTWIPFRLSKDSDVTIEVYDIAGRLIRKLQLGYIPAGSYVARDMAAYWDGRNEAGERAASGVYFYSIKTNDFTSTKKMTIVR